MIIPAAVLSYIAATVSSNFIHAHSVNAGVGAGLPDAAATPNCFPAIGFKTPTAVPSTTNDWWCDKSAEYAFVGFSYEVTECA
jgi:hypothetical protein